MTEAPLDLRASPPVPQGGAPCGIVDYLDFPLDPPDGERANGGGDFGVYRERYQGNHAGEDWRIRYGASLGAPVYSAGHGTVTYAQPNGWGADKGTVIVRHVDASGQVFYSFYGHLEPESVLLRAGDCVARGDQVGKIGKPRTPPHLHFEIRSHLPAEPGPGYWGIDPSLAGWYPPSQTIWRSRIEGAPGVLWVRDTQAGSLSGVAVYSSTLIAIQDSHLIGISLQDGSQQWEYKDEEEITGAAVGDRILYLAYQNRTLKAFALSAAGSGSDANAPFSPEPLWQTRLGFSGTPALMPLPNGGVAAAALRMMAAFSSSGKQLWELEYLAPIAGWTTWEGGLVYSNWGRERSLWTLEASGAQEWSSPLNGIPLGSPDGLFLYSPAGVYVLDPLHLTADEILPLYPSSAVQGDAIALPDGNLLIAHSDRYDRRLIVIDSGGTVLWERSVSSLPAGSIKLMLAGRRVYLLLLADSSGSGKALIYALDFESGRLNQIFTGGTRTPRPQDTWFLNGSGDIVYLNIGGGSLVAIDLEQAQEALSVVSNQE